MYDFSAIVQRIARSGLFPSRGEVQDVAPSVRPKAIHFPGFDLRLGLDTGMLIICQLFIELAFKINDD